MYIKILLTAVQIVGTSIVVPLVDFAIKIVKVVSKS